MTVRVSPPKRLVLRQQGQRLRVEFATQPPFDFSAEFLRVFSPSAEVQGHGQSESNLIGGKRGVSIRKVEPVGRYAVRLVFSDGHDSGLYAWDTLQQLGTEQEDLWAIYLQRLAAAGMSRDEAQNIVPLSVLKPRNALKD